MNKVRYTKDWWYEEKWRETHLPLNGCLAYLVSKIDGYIWARDTAEESKDFHETGFRPYVYFRITTHWSEHIGPEVSENDKKRPI